MINSRTPLLSVVAERKYTTENTDREVTSKLDLSKISSELRYEFMLAFSGDFATLRCVNKGFKEKITPSKMGEISGKQFEYCTTYLQWRIEAWTKYIIKNVNNLTKLLNPFFSMLPANHPLDNGLRNALNNANFNEINNGVDIANEFLQQAHFQVFQRRWPRVGFVGAITASLSLVGLPFAAVIAYSPATPCAFLANPLTISAAPTCCGTFTATLGIMHCLKLDACRPGSIKNADNAIKEFTKESKLSVILNTNLLLTQLKQAKFKRDRFGAFLFFKNSPTITRNTKLVFSTKINSKIAEFLGCEDLREKTKFNM